jgi:UDP-N-acetylglucosamine diphosphorylase/glucosamine-1-phosphate N-acetyltransferase
MVHYVIDLTQKLNSKRTILIVGHKRELVEEACVNLPVEFVTQEPQLGTGHAVQMTEPLLKDFNGDVLVLSGDVPLLTEQTLTDLAKVHNESSAAATMLTSELDDPTGYGRVIRDESGFVKKIAEHKDASEEERRVNEINVGIYIFQAKKLFEALHNVDNNNVQGEYYLPDVIPMFIADGLIVNAVKTPNFDETRGINTIAQLKEAEDVLNSRN